MKTSLFFALTIALAACVSKPMSETQTDGTADFNGSFEKWVNGLPANRSVYTPNTIEDALFQIKADTLNTTNGQKTLLLDIEKCSPEGGRFSPGVFREIPVTEPGTYTITFSIANPATPCRLTAGGVMATDGSTRQNDIKTGPLRNESITATVHKGEHKLRIEFNALGAGNVWLDDFKIEGPNGWTN